MAEPSPRVGWIGLGIMGAPMARNLARAGFPVTAWNRSTPRRDAWVREGGRVGASPAEVARVSDVVFTMVADSPDVEQVILGAEGVVHGCREGQVVVDASTIAPAVARSLAARLAERGVAFLDAPVSGGDTGARAGTLSIMVGGDETVFERCRSLFEVLGSRVTRMGPSGAGQATKLSNQVAVVGTLLAVCEALRLGKASGLDPGRLVEALSGGAAGSWQLEHLGPKIDHRDFAPGFPIGLARKDLRLVMEAASEAGVMLPGTRIVCDLLAAIGREDADDLGTQAMILALERLVDGS